MYLDTEFKAVCTNFFEELRKTDDAQNQIYFTVLYFIHSAPHLSMLYLNWTNLKKYEKCVLNNQMKLSTAKTGKVIYPPIIRAFKYWDMVQDTYGAPGFNCNPLKTELSEETDRDIVKMLVIMEKIINQIYLKHKLITEISSHNDSRNILYSYKWRIICKNMNKKRSHLTNARKEMPKNGGGSDEENYSSDLNGCGDTTWLSDIE